jgi:hydroxymethylglutaryl-CoA lyase
MTLPRNVRIVEVGARDGLQNEARILPVAVKAELIDRLAGCGLKAIEAAAFVSPKWVPQMADSADLMQTIVRREGVAYPVLVPNLKGLELALASGAKEVAVFGAASESFSQKNINCSIAESFERFREVIDAAKAAEIKVRGYLSCVLGCPFEGEVSLKLVADLTRSLLEMGCYEVSLGDTIGVGTPVKVMALIEAVTRRAPLKKIAGHFHDTYGMAIANIYAALDMGMGVFDASVAGLGGCPYAPGAAGNVATEDVVWLLQGLGIETGIDLRKLADTGTWISRQLGRESSSRVGRALVAHQ